MTFATPLAFWLLPLILLPPFLAARRTPHQRRVVAALYLWERLTPPEPATLTVKRLNTRWLVALQMLLIAAVIVGIARPSIAVATTQWTFVFDVSASMAARDGSGTRLDQARERARTLISGLPRRARVRVMAAGANTRNLGEFNADGAQLLAALDELQATAGGGDLQTAVHDAAVVTAGGSIAVFTDRAGAAPEDAAWTAGRSLKWETVGSAADNVAISDLFARRLPLSPAEIEILVAVRNYGAAVNARPIEVALGDQVIDRRTLDIDAGGVARFVVRSRAANEIVRARLLTADALESDNTRLAVVPSVAPVHIAVRNRINVFVSTALHADRDVEFDDATTSAATDIVVCESCALTAEAASVLLLDSAAEGTSEGAVTISRPTHPLAASLDLAQVTSAKVAQRQVPDDADVVLRAGGAPAVVAYERDHRRIVEIRIDLATSDFPFSTNFPILIANALDWLAFRNEDTGEVVAGEPLIWHMPRVMSASAQGPGGRDVPVRVVDGQMAITDTQLPGAYEVRTTSETRRFVVNPAVAGESNLREMAIADAAPAETTQSAIASAASLALIRWFVALALVLYLLEWRWRGGGVTMPRAAGAVLLTIGVIGLEVPTRQAAISVVALLDRSASISPRGQQDELEAVNAQAATMRSQDRLGVVLFGEDAVVEARPAERVHLASVQSSINDSGTDIGGALRLARGLLPAHGGGRVVIVSDGRETTGRAVREAAFAAAAGVAIDVVPPADNLARGLAVTRIAAPSDVATRAPFPVSVEIQGAPDARGGVRVFRDGEPFATATIQVPAGGTAVVNFADVHDEPGVHAYRASVTPGGDAVNSAARGAETVVTISGQPSILYVSTLGRLLEPALASAGFRVLAASPESVPTSAGRLADYTAVVLDDVSAERFTVRQSGALAEYVERFGGGLLLLGSSRSLTLSGYSAGPLERVLPVDLRPRTGSRSASLGLVLVFDKSGSMGDLAAGTPKIEFARRSVMRVLDVLPASDSLGVIAFDRLPVAVAPLAAGQDRQAIADRLRTVDAGGSTLIAPAVAMAVEWLRQAGASVSRKHVLLISDGRTSGDDAAALMAAVATAGIEVSAVAIGANVDEALLQRIATASGGRMYRAAEISELPQIAAREAERSAGGATVEESFTARAGSHPALTGIALTSMPSLGGYVVAAAKPTASTILSSPLGDPILCAWQAGLGRTAVFTASLGSPWSASLRTWNQNAQLWTQVVRWLGRNVSNQRLTANLASTPSGAHLIVDAFQPDGRSIDLSAAHATLSGTGGNPQELTLEPSAPGRYEAFLPSLTTGRYIVSASGVDRETGAEHHVVRSLFWASEQEQLAGAPDIALLKRLADMTGGRMLGPRDSPFNQPRSLAYRDVTAWLAAIALAIFIGDLTRRPRFGGHSLRARRRGTAAAAPKRVAA